MRRTETIEAKCRSDHWFSQLQNADCKFVTDEQWDELVEHWKIEKKMVISSNYATSYHVDFICA